MAALYLDEDVHQGTSALLSALGLSVIHARDRAKGAKDDVSARGWEEHVSPPL